jgi:hypothetical protein
VDNARPPQVLQNTFFDGPIWGYFGLTYSAYLVLPRVSLCSMPLGWQRRFVALMLEAERVLPEEGRGGEYAVQMRDRRGRFVKDPLSDYRHHRPLQLVDGPRRHQVRRAMKNAGVNRG